MKSVRVPLIGMMVAAAGCLGGCGGDPDSSAMGASDQAIGRNGSAPAGSGYGEPTEAKRAPERPGPLCLEHALDDAKACMPANVFNEKAGTVCSWFGLQLQSLTLNDPCGPGVWLRARFACCATANGVPNKPDGREPNDPNTARPVPTPPSASACFASALSAPCSPDLELRRKAIEQCSTQGMVLTEFGLGDECGKGLYKRVKFACCANGPAPGTTEPAPIAPPAPPDANACIGGGFSGPCSPYFELKQQAAEQCKASGMQLTDMGVGAPCGPELFQAVKFTCCANRTQPAPTPPVPAPTCFSSAIGDMNSCIKPEDLKIKAMEICAQKGSANLVDFASDGGCSNGLSHMAKFTCCVEGAPKPPVVQPPVVPPPQPACLRDVLENRATCLADWEWKERIWAMCEAKGMRDLRGYGTDGSCGPGSSHAAKFECCELPADVSAVRNPSVPSTDNK